jgi:hypothetical protein
MSIGTVSRVVPPNRKPRLVERRRRDSSDMKDESYALGSTACRPAVTSRRQRKFDGSGGVSA